MTPQEELRMESSNEYLPEQSSSSTSSDTSHGSSAKARACNLSDRERLLSSLTGGALFLYGLRNMRGFKGKLALLSSLELLRRGATGHCRLYEALGVDSTPRGKAEGKGFLDPHPFSIRQSITVLRPLDDCYLFCTDLMNARRYIPNVYSVEQINSSRSRWTFTDQKKMAQIPIDVNIIEGGSNTNTVTWQAFVDTKLDVSGTIRFREAPRPGETEISVDITINPPIGAVGAAFMKAIGPVTRSMVEHTLHRFKQLIETGEIATTTDQSSGRAAKTSFAVLRRDWTNKLRIKTVQKFGERRVS
jgi:uncharacterized membrane protein